MRRLALLALWLPAMTACPLDASIGREKDEFAGEGEAETLTSDGDGTAEGEGSSNTASEGGSGGGEGGGSDGNGPHNGTGSDAANLCEAADNDSACGLCRKNHCCDEVVVCHDSPGCFCYWNCIIDPKQTAEACGAACEYPARDEWDNVLACQLDACQPECAEHPPTDAPK